MSGKCPSCHKKVINFQLDEAIKEYIHLFEMIGIFSAIALLLPQLTLGLKDIGILTISEKQMIPLYFSLVFCSILIIFFWIAIVARISEYRHFSPVRRFFPSQEKIWITIRKGDIQYYFFIVCFMILYILITMYIISTFTAGLFILVIVVAGFGIIAEIYDYFSNDKDEREEEQQF